MLKNLRSILLYKSFVLTFATTCFLNCALAMEIARSQDLDKRISIDVEKKTLKETLDQISRQTHIGIIYSNAKDILRNPVTIHAKEQPVNKVLSELLSPLKLTYEIIGGQIVIKFDNTSSRPASHEQSEKQRFPIKGKVTDGNGLPLPGATIRIKDGTALATTDSNGEFQINNVSDSTIVQVSFVGYVTKEIVVTNANYLTVTLENDSNQLNEVSVVSTGYQTIPKERATGSFVQIDNQLLNRSISTNILDRLNGVTSGLIFNNNNAHQFGQANIEIRGRATLFSNPNPLIIVDNFPYNGDITNINPNDVENITILKDAAAASAWGSRSGNGVIVITTKKGRLNSAPTISFNANTTIGEKPNLYYTPQLSSAQYIDVEQFLFNKGAYNSTINNGYAALSPAVQIFLAKRSGTISAADSLTQINTLKGYDARQQMLKYFYRPSVNQQYQASISGGSSNQKYFISGGYDKDLNNLVNSNYNRVTLNASNSYYFLKNKLELYSNIIYTGTKTQTGPVYQPAYPYSQIADTQGNPIPVANTLRLSYVSTAGNGKLLNWLYEPLDELNNSYSNIITNQTDYRLNFSLSYKILKGLKASALYSYERGVSESNNVNELESYYSRNLINTFTQINATTGAVTHPVPVGGILNNNQTDIRSNDGRFQINYENNWNKSSVNALAGIEIDNYNSFNGTYSLYGYNPETASNQNSAVNFNTYYPYFYNTTTSTINPNTTQLGITNRFFSEYFNGSYVYDERYIATLSVRKDESNLFGVSENQKGVPLWSAGLAWAINKESFYKIDWLPELKLKVTYGYTGTVNNSISAYLTAINKAGLAQTYNAYFSNIVNPPNPSLRWEKDKNINLGLEFSTKGNRINGSIDFWQKNGYDLIGNSPIAPQTGITLYTGNSANTSTKGIDLIINSININGSFKWFTTLLYNHVTSLVTNYKVTNGTNLNVISANYNNPLQGYPYYAIFSFKNAGLNNTGDPQGYLNGNISTDYSGIMNSTNRAELVYNGSATPTSFGSLRNSFMYRSFDLSFNIIYKLGYFFRRQSLDNSTVYSAGPNGYLTADYSNRWQKPGDELHTDVPALIYPSNSIRNQLYTYSNILVENADHIRLQDIRIGYTFPHKSIGPFKNLNVFTYMNNIGILWRANKYHIDPDYPTGIPVPRTISFGLKSDL